MKVLLGFQDYTRLSRVPRYESLVRVPRLYKTWQGSKIIQDLLGFQDYTRLGRVPRLYKTWQGSKI